MEIFYDFFGESSPFGDVLDKNKDKFDLKPRALQQNASDLSNKSNIHLDLRCSLEELYNQSSKAVMIERQRFDSNNRSYVDTKVLLLR